MEHFSLSKKIALGGLFSANRVKQARKAVPKEAKRYAHELFEEINKDRKNHGKKPLEENSRNTPEEPETVEKTVSLTDPDRGVFQKGEHKKVFAHQAQNITTM